MNIFLKSLKRVAVSLDRGRGPLILLGLVHRVEAPDRWDLIVSSPKLQPWTLESLNYVNKHLQRELTTEQVIRIARIVALPADNEVVKWLLEHRQGEARKPGLSLADRFDKFFVVWPSQTIPGRSRSVRQISRNLLPQKRMATETR